MGRFVPETGQLISKHNSIAIYVEKLEVESLQTETRM